MTTVRAQVPPSAATAFVGREQALADVRRTVRSARLLTVTGAGGIGKTRLALAATAGLGGCAPDGVWLVPLAPVRSGAGVATATAVALGLPDLGLRPALDQLTGYLAERRALLVLDNCEHLVDACAELVSALLLACPGLRILATSRRTLDVTGECVYALAPLSPAESAELLRVRAGEIGADHRVGEADGAEVARLYAGLDGLPLAIELAASRLRTLGVAEVAAGLEDRFALLSPGRPALRAAIDWSHELCTPAERALWSRLSVFAGGFTLEAVEEVCGGEGVSRWEVVDLLDQLVSQSVVLVEEGDAGPRYRMLEALRAYGQERLAGLGERGRTARRHRDFFLALARRTAAGWFGPGQERALARLRAEHGNVLAALEGGAGAGESADGGQARLELAAALGFHWCCNGFVGEGRRRLDQALADAPEPTPARAAALWTAAWVAQIQGDLDTAEHRLDEADMLGELLGDPLLRAYVRGERGTLALYRGRPHDAVPLFEGAVAVQSELEGEPSALRWLFQLALAQMYLGDPASVRTARRAVATADAHGERLTRAYALWVLGYDAWLRGSAEESTAVLRTALEIHRDFHDHAGVAMALEVLAWGSAALGEHRRAALLLGALGPLARELGSTCAGHFAEPRARCEEAIVAELGPDAYAEALAEGGRYDTPRRAVGLALGDAPAPPALTRKEREVAAHVARGLDSRQISLALGRSPRTVEGHLQSVLTKLGFTCPAQIAAWWTANEPVVHEGV
ncbi:helix-turn-helix transcriptional regulator [Streptomyces acidiscabies]|uniref:LuxR family transcriptional regulator n=1 Tax=Streptomyces acidiscabies TaxID=42234 RepID=A0A0L0JRQ4_9ACTN|nr:LuxR C-terminal-related transcriptional regulator [Streptomyces acidiscabies]KND28248.1 LuxR family transcriptional regulator [Streptomyces acidiscabies]